MQSHFLVHNEAFLALVDPEAHLEEVAGGMKWTEGPVYQPQGGFYLWSDIPNNALWRWQPGMSPTLETDAANNCNGHTLDRDGHLISCEHLTRRVTRTTLDGACTVLADSYGGRRLNSPNDVVVKSDGSIWFTDPPYGILSDYEGRKADQEQDGCFVFRLSPDGKELTVVSDDFVKPNGLAFSPGEDRLYVSDTGQSHDPDGPHHIRVFDVLPTGELTGGDVFIETPDGVPDGFRFDTLGNLWTSSATGVLCYDPTGLLLGEIRTPEVVSNLCFGGRTRQDMMITATSSVFHLTVRATGC